MITILILTQNHHHYNHHNFYVNFLNIVIIKKLDVWDCDSSFQTGCSFLTSYGSSRDLNLLISIHHPQSLTLTRSATAPQFTLQDELINGNQRMEMKEKDEKKEKKTLTFLSPIVLLFFTYFPSFPCSSFLPIFSKHR